MKSTTNFLRHRATIGIGAAALAVATTLVVQHVRAAGVPTTAALTYVGNLGLVDGTPVNGSKNIGLSLYDAASAGNRLCDVVSGPVSVINGRFQITLPETCTAAVKANNNTWIDVQVDGGSIGRTKLGAVPYALEAGNAVQAASASGAAALTGAVKVLESASDVTQTGTLSSDLVYTNVAVDITPGTWLIEAHATIRTTDVQDDVAIGLYDATNSSDIANSRSGLAYVPAVATLGSCALHTSKVLTVTATTTIRLKGYRNGSSTLQFGSVSPVVMTSRNRILAVQLSSG